MQSKGNFALTTKLYFMQKVKVNSFKILPHRQGLAIDLSTPFGKCIDVFDTCVVQGFGKPCPFANYSSENSRYPLLFRHFTCDKCGFSLPVILETFILK